MLKVTPEAIIIFLLIAILDLRYRQIPDVLTIPGIFAGIYLNASIGGMEGFMFALWGMSVGFYCLFLCGAVSMRLIGRPQIGGGDLKLLMMIGSLYGPIVALWIFAIAPILGSLYAIGFQKSKIPYGAFMILSWLIIFIGGV